MHFIITPMLGCKSDHTWFDACHSDDLDTVKVLAKRHVHTHDKRDQYIGFTGLMHAAISDAAVVFAYLLPIELDDVTTEYNELLAPSVSNISQIRTAPGTTALMIVLISNSYKCLQQYIRYSKSVTHITTQATSGPQNAEGLSAFHFAGIVQSNIGYIYLNSDIQTIIQDISAKAVDGMMPLHAVLYYKRVQILQYLIDLTEQYIQSKKKIVLESKERYHTQHQLEILIHTLKQQIHEPYNNYSCLELSQRSPQLMNHLEISNEDSSATYILYQKFIKLLDSTQ